jgi:tetratricopeptide (TPR) repeat protein
MIHPISSFRLPRLLAATLLLAWGAVCLNGCASLPLFNSRAALERQLDNDPNYSIASIQGPTERQLNTNLWNKKRGEINPEEDLEAAEALAAYERARELFDQEQYAAAEKEFKRIAKQRRDVHESFGARFRRFWGISEREDYDPYSNFGDPIEEDSLFMAAEAQFAQQRYAKAQNSYEELLNRYPSTRHLDKVTRQLFRIARHWLDFSEDLNEQGDVEIQLAHAESEASDSSPAMTQPSSLSRFPLLPNLTDRSRPTFDTYGRGLQALRSIWLHDATGPLADDALMLAANHNLRTGNFVEAARLYGLLRDQYPDSPHLKDAFLLGSYVTLASYQGPAYDGKALEDARSLKEATLQMFHDLSPEERQRLQEEVRKLKEAEVARLWDLVHFYQVKGVDSAVALHCHLIINKFPDSQYAEMARDALREQDEKIRQANATPSWLTGRNRRQAQNTLGAYDTKPGRATLPPSDSSGETEPSRQGERLDDLLRRSERTPQLEPIEEQTPPRDSHPLDAHSLPPGRARL